MTSTEENSTEQFLLILNTDEYESVSKVCQLENSDLSFKLTFRNLPMTIEGIVTSSLFIYVERKRLNIFGNFKLRINGVLEGSCVTQMQASLSYSNDNSREHFLATFLFPKNLQFTTKVTWTRTQNKELTEAISSSLTPSLSWLQQSEEFSDVDIETEDGTRIHVHKNILSARSHVFRAMLRSDMSEAKTSCINIPDFSTETTKCMITYIYTNGLPEFRYDLATELLMAADKYELDYLKKACVIQLLQHVNTANAVDLLLISDTYREKKMKDKTLEFISDNWTEFTHPSKFVNLVERNPTLLAEVICFVARGS